jgi:hypothetical protein
MGVGVDEHEETNLAAKDHRENKEGAVVAAVYDRRRFLTELTEFLPNLRNWDAVGSRRCP